MAQSDPSLTTDLFIIGGGINGCGIARDAVGRGLSVELAEMNDLASATSSASTKLFHGGLRYLEYWEIRLVREALIDTGYKVTPVLDRNYFKAIYFRTPGGVLFEVATNNPGFGHDEPAAELGQNLKLPPQHEHLRDFLNEHLEPV